MMEAGLAATQVGLVRDVVMEKRRRMEVLDGRSRRHRARDVTANRRAGREADERAMPLARILREAHEGVVEVAVDVRILVRGNVPVHQLAHLVRAQREVIFEAFRIRMGLRERFHNLC